MWRLADERRGVAAASPCGGERAEGRHQMSTRVAAYGLISSLQRQTGGGQTSAGAVATSSSPSGGARSDEHWEPQAPLLEAVDGRKGRRRWMAWPHAEGVAADLVEPVRSLRSCARDLRPI